MKQATHGTDFTFEIWQGGKIVAHAASPDLVTAQRQATHLALAYSQSGPEPVTVRGSNGALLVPAPNALGYCGPARYLGTGEVD